MPSRRVHKEALTLGVGSLTTTTNLNPVDLSHAQSLQIELLLTTIGTDVGDTLDVKLQDTSIDAAGNVTWNTRARFPLILGNVAAPVAYRLVLEQAISISQSEQSYQEASSGAGEIAAGSVRNGIFPGKGRTPGFVRAGQSNQTPLWRMQYVQVDAGTQNAGWAGSLVIWSYTPVRY